jgi:hypothetical protein
VLFRSLNFSWILGRAEMEETKEYAGKLNLGLLQGGAC